MIESHVRDLHGARVSQHDDEPLGELALRIAKATDAKVDALAVTVGGVVGAVQRIADQHEAEAKERAEEAKARAKRTVRNVIGGSSAVTVVVALIGGFAQIQVARTAASTREQTREVASQTASADDGRALQIAQAAAREAVKQALAERERETAPLRVRPDASALARKESFE